jgi:hypothetical protein
MSTYPAVQSLWIGPSLSTLERLTIASFLANGHGFHLYAYDHIAGVPAGTEVMDAGRILPRSGVFRYSGNGSVAGFSNFFRYRLLLERGGWWVDLDTVCLQPLHFESEYVFSSEVVNGVAVIDAAAIHAPPGSPWAQYAWRVCESKDVTRLVWGETGPRLLAEAVAHCGLLDYVRPPETFCPIGYADWESASDPQAFREFGPEVFAVHLWNEMWRRSGKDKDANYPAGCLWERLKSRYLGSKTPA